MKALTLWVLLLLATLAHADYYLIPDNIAEGGPVEEKCELVSGKTIEEGIAIVKLSRPYCKEPKKTLVRDTVLVYCKHPTNSYESKVLKFSKSKDSCHAFLEFSKTNLVPKGFEVKK